METMPNKVNSEVGEENPKINKEEVPIPQLQLIQTHKMFQVPGHNVEVQATEETLREEAISPAEKGITCWYYINT